MVSCKRCHRVLKNKESEEREYGPVCWNKVIQNRRIEVSQAGVCQVRGGSGRALFQQTGAEECQECQGTGKVSPEKQKDQKALNDQMALDFKPKELEWINEETYKCRKCGIPVDKSIPTGYCSQECEMADTGVITLESR